MKRGWIRDEEDNSSKEDNSSIDDVYDDFYSLNVREKLLEDDEIDSREEGFMNGYEKAV